VLVVVLRVESPQNDTVPRPEHTHESAQKPATQQPDLQSLFPLHAEAQLQVSPPQVATVASSVPVQLTLLELPPPPPPPPPPEFDEQVPLDPQIGCALSQQKPLPQSMGKPDGQVPPVLPPVEPHDELVEHWPLAQQ
jgi:hypothetical protein